jgi:hypothetical protein
VPLSLCIRSAKAKGESAATRWIHSRMRQGNAGSHIFRIDVENDDQVIRAQVFDKKIYPAVTHLGAYA